MTTDTNNSQQTSKRAWLIKGLIFGVLMFIIMELLFPLFVEEGIDRTQLIFKAVVWLVLGLLWGLLMKYIERRTKS